MKTSIERPSPLFTLGLALVCASLLILALLVQRVFDQYPSALSGEPSRQEAALRYFPLEDLLKAKMYQGEKLKHRINLGIVSVSFLLFILGSLVFRRLWSWARFGSQKLAAILKVKDLPQLTPWLYGFIFFVFFSVIQFPEVFYRGYLLEKRFGLRLETLPSWLSHYFTSQGLTLLFFLGGYLLFLFFYRKSNRYWFVPLTGMAWVFGAILVALTPVLIDPLFYEFERLPQGQLREDLEVLAEQAGIGQNEIYVMKASARTARINAYVTGFGKTKRIVLYDNLLQEQSPEEIKAVLAHEIAHWQKHHVLKGVFLSLGFIFLTLSLTALLLEFLFKKPLFREAQGQEAILLPLVMLILFTFSFLLQPLGNAISRHFESDADEIALTLTQDPASFIAIQVDLAKKNLNDVLAHRATVFLFFTHPPTLERIAMAEKFKDQTLESRF